MPQNLNIPHPKQKASAKSGFESFYSYYAGFPESFASSIISSAALASGSVVYDPWNGSGTTTKSAATLGYASVGVDLNPVMVVVSKARLLPASELPSLLPLAREAIYKTRAFRKSNSNDPLSNWLTSSSRDYFRQLERAVSSIMIPSSDERSKYNFEMSCIAASMYLALFATGKELCKAFKTSNPTWIRKARSENEKLDISKKRIHDEFLCQIEKLVAAHLTNSKSTRFDFGANISIGNSTNKHSKIKADLVLTSPPYCTRIDYTAATSVELAILDELGTIVPSDLSKLMLGTPKIGKQPTERIILGDACNHFLEQVKNHSSKASDTYYYKTHLDYYQKIALSLESIYESLTENGKAVLVVQNSYYKDIHNDIANIISEIADLRGLKLGRREDFRVLKNIATINPRAPTKAKKLAVESVLCFSKN